MNAAFELGRQKGLATDYITKAERKALLFQAGLDSSKVCEAFEAGRTSGISERKTDEKPAKEAEALRVQEIREHNDRLCKAVTSAMVSHRGEELHDYATRKLFENSGLIATPSCVVEAIQEFEAGIK